MPVWREKGRGWRYRFVYRGMRYYNTAERGQPPTYRTKAEARAEESRHKAEVKKQGSQQTRLTFLEVANEYLKWSERRHTPKTWKYKCYVFRSFIAFTGNLPLDRLSLPVIESYLQTRHSNINANRHRKDLCALLRWAFKRRFILSDPCAFLEKLPEPRFVRVIPTPEEMAKIFLAAGAHRPFLLVLYHTLGRLDEILRLRWEDVNFEERTVKLWTRKRKDGSWQGDILPMNQVLETTLKALWRARTGDFVFMNPKTQTRYNRRPKLMRTICLRAGVRHLGFHAIRHYVASLLHDREKVGVAQVSKLLRHQNKATTERYLQVVDQVSREAMATLEHDTFSKAPLTGSPGSD